MKRTEAIIDSMTKAERNNHKIIDASRKTRIAGGSGTTIAEVNQLLRQYEQMRKMMAQMNKGGMLAGLGKKMMGGLAGGLGGMLGGGGMPGMGGMGGGLAGMLGAGSAGGDDDSGPSRTKKKKRHKKKK
jgi:signal recognition particle subunit SRP54